MPRKSNSSIYGLNVQAPWAELIVSGKKTVETRHYPLPEKLIGQPILLIETPGPKGLFAARGIGIVTFSRSYKYESQADFYFESDLHLVHPDTPLFAWKDSNGKPKWAWPIVDVRRFGLELSPTLKRGRIFTKSIPIHSS